jgi:excisionase family DNA binding protein
VKDDPHPRDEGTRTLDDRLLSTSKLAEMLGVSVATLRWWIHNGTAPDHFKIGRHIKFRESDVLRWLEARRRRGGTAA